MFKRQDNDQIEFLLQHIKTDNSKFQLEQKNSACVCWRMITGLLFVRRGSTLCHCLLTLDSVFVVPGYSASLT